MSGSLAQARHFTTSWLSGTPQGPWVRLEREEAVDLLEFTPVFGTGLSLIRKCHYHHMTDGSWACLPCD